MSARKKIGYWQLFVFLSFMYFVYFYILPLVSVFVSRQPISYANTLFYIGQKDIVSCLLYGIIFFVSFLCSVRFFAKLDKPPGFLCVPYVVHRIKIFSYILVFALILYNSIYLDTSLNYDVRSGIEQGNQFAYFIQIFINSLAVFLVFKTDEFGLKRQSFLLLFVILCISLVSGAGRQGILITIILLLSLLKKDSINFRNLVIANIAFILLLPLVINLKKIIYAIGMYGSLESVDFRSIYYFDDIIAHFIDNFGHPVISMFVADQTIEISGLRYFYDYIQGFLFYLKPFGFDFGMSITYYNTNIILGVFRSVIPPGHIAFGYLQFYFIGVIFSGFFFAAIGFSCNFVRLKVAPTSNLATIFFSFAAANTFYHGDIRIIVMSVFVPLIFFVLFQKIFGFKEMVI